MPRILFLASCFFLMQVTQGQIPKAPERKEGDGPWPQLILRGATLINGTGSPAIGPVDIVVVNATPDQPHHPIEEYTWEFYQSMLNFFLISPFLLTRAVLPHMKQQKWGRIINIGGTDAYWGKVRRAHGVSAKLGLVGLTRAMALEVARFGVTINVVIPGTIDTVRPHPEWYPELKSGYAERLQRIPMARLGQSQDVANACLYLVSELASFTTAQELFASGGAVPLVRQTLDEYTAEDF